MALGRRQQPSRRRLSDRVRGAAVRAGVLLALAVQSAMIAALGVLGHSLIWLPATFAAAVFLLGSLFGLLEVLIAHQMHAEEVARARGEYEMHPLQPRTLLHPGRTVPER